MAKELLRLERIPHRLFFDKQQAKVEYAEHSSSYDQLMMWLPKLEEIKEIYGIRSFRPDFRLDPDNIPFWSCGLWAVSCLPALLLLIVSLPAYVGTLGFNRLLPVSSRRRNLAEFTNQLKTSSAPRLIELIVSFVEHLPGGAAVLHTDRGVYDVDAAALSEYRLAGSPEVVYCLANSHEITDGSKSVVSPAVAIGLLRRTDATSRRILVDETQTHITDVGLPR